MFFFSFSPRKLLPLPLLLLGIVASATTESSPSPAIVIFVIGDFTISCAAITLPNFTSPSLAAGPCLFPSTRRLLPDLLAAKMGLPPPPLITTLNGTVAATARDVNFGSQYGERGIFRLGAVGQQLHLAAEMLQQLQLEAAAQRDVTQGRCGHGVHPLLQHGNDTYACFLARRPVEADTAAPKHGCRGFGCLLADHISPSVLVL